MMTLAVGLGGTSVLDGATGLGQNSQPARIAET